MPLATSLGTRKTLRRYARRIRCQLGDVDASIQSRTAWLGAVAGRRVRPLVLLGLGYLAGHLFWQRGQ